MHVCIVQYEMKVDSCIIYYAVSLHTSVRPQQTVHSVNTALYTVDVCAICIDNLKLWDKGLDKLVTAHNMFAVGNHGTLFRSRT